MGGDLNLKKSWHPALMCTQEKMWAAREAAQEEEKKVVQLQRERDEERSLEQLKELQHTNQATGEQVAVDSRLAWMCQAPLHDDALLDALQETYLLGKRRVDKLIQTPDEDLRGNNARRLPSHRNHGKCCERRGSRTIPGSTPSNPQSPPSAGTESGHPHAASRRW